MSTKLSAYWIPIAAVAAFALGALLFKGCGAKVETQYLPINLDSLKATIKPDTVTLPGNQVTRIVRVPVLLSDTGTIDSLLAHFGEQRDYYEALIEKLNTAEDWGWDFGSVELPMQTTIFADSVETSRYFHKWRIEAEGPIKSYTYGILPICPQVQPITVKTPKQHRVGPIIGGQFGGGQILPVYGVQYQYRFLTTKAAYIPALSSLQLEAGFTIGIK